MAKRCKIERLKTISNEQIKLNKNIYDIFTYVFIKVTMYMTRGVQIMGWSVSIALMACLTQYSGFSGGNSGAISFLFKNR